MRSRISTNSCQLLRRIRGYQFKPGYAEPKRNPRAYGRLDEAVEKFEASESASAVATPDAGSEELQSRGFAEKTD